MGPISNLKIYSDLNQIYYVNNGLIYTKKDHYDLPTVSKNRELTANTDYQLQFLTFN